MVFWAAKMVDCFAGICATLRFAFFERKTKPKRAARSKGWSEPAEESVIGRGEQATAKGARKWKCKSRHSDNNVGRTTVLAVDSASTDADPAIDGYTTNEVSLYIVSLLKPSCRVFPCHPFLSTFNRSPPFNKTQFQFHRMKLKKITIIAILLLAFT